MDKRNSKQEYLKINKKINEHTKPTKHRTNKSSATKIKQTQHTNFKKTKQTNNTL